MRASFYHIYIEENRPENAFFKTASQSCFLRLCGFYKSVLSNLDSRFVFCEKILSCERFSEDSLIRHLNFEVCYNMEMEVQYAIRSA